MELVDKKGTAYLQGIQGLNYLGKMSGYKKPMNILKSYLKTNTNNLLPVFVHSHHVHQHEINDKFGIRKPIHIEHIVCF